jgi:hypothetical protein
MSLPTNNGTAGVHEHKFDPDSNEAKTSPRKKPDFEITPSSEEATAAPREKAPRSKKSKLPPTNKPAPRPASALKLPFEFADEHFSQAVAAQMVNACATREGFEQRYLRLNGICHVGTEAKRSIRNDAHESYERP